MFLGRIRAKRENILIVVNPERARAQSAHLTISVFPKDLEGQEMYTACIQVSVYSLFERVLWAHLHEDPSVEISQKQRKQQARYLSLGTSEGHRVTVC